MRKKIKEREEIHKQFDHHHLTDIRANMPSPSWRKHLIEAQLERVTKDNYNDVARRIVMILDSRSIVQSTSHLVVQRINRWYMPSFSEELDRSKRNICDNFLASLLHAIAVRTKHIKGVPTREGLSGIPLFKSDLLSTSLHGRQRIGPVVVSLFNSGNMMIDDVVEIVEACLEPIQSSIFLQRLSDAILIIEFAQKQMMKFNFDQFVFLMDQIQSFLIKNQDWASKKIRICDRDIPNLFQRFFTLQKSLKQTEEMQRNETESVRKSSMQTSTDVYSMTISRLSEDYEEEEESLFNQTISSYSEDDDDDEEEEAHDGTTASTMDGKYSYSEGGTVIDISPALASSQIKSAFMESTSSLISSEIIPKEAIMPSVFKVPTRLAQERQVKPSKSTILQDVFVPLQVDITQSGELLSECLMKEIEFLQNNDDEDEKTPTINKDKFDAQEEEEEESLSSIIQVGKLPNTIRFFFPAKEFTKEQVNFITQVMKIELNNIGNEIIFYNNQQHSPSSFAIAADKFQLLNDGSAFQTFHIGQEIEIDVIYSANMTLSQISDFGQKIVQILTYNAF